MKNEAQLSPNNRNNGALPECSGNSEASAIGSNHLILNTPAQHKCGDFDFRPSAQNVIGGILIDALLEEVPRFLAGMEA